MTFMVLLRHGRRLSNRLLSTISNPLDSRCFSPRIHCINQSDDIASELKKLRELLATNRDERLRLRKNVAKIRRLFAKVEARTKGAAVPDQAAHGPVLDLLQTLYSVLAASFQDIQPRDESAAKCLSRLVIRCKGCATRKMELADHPTQLEGVVFEYILLRKAQGDDTAQAERYASINSLISVIKSTVQKRILPKSP